jgi:hypothetical protein
MTWTIDSTFQNTLIIEDGSGGPPNNFVTNANSYQTILGFLNFAAARQYTIITDPSILLIQAMDYLETLRYIGIRKTINQTLQWPRWDVWIDGWLVIDTTIPWQLLNAQCQVAMAIDMGYSPMSLLPRNIKTQSLSGVASIEYAPGTGPLVIARAIGMSLWKITIAGSMGNSMVVSKG